LEERISQLLNKGIMMLSKLILLRMDHAPERSLNTLTKLLDQSMLKIVEKLGDYKNETLKDKLTQLICDIVDSDLLSFSEICEWLTRTKGLPRSLSGFKHIVGKLMALKNVLCRFESEVISCYRSILGHCCTCLENSNSEVRNQASSLIVEVYRVIGGQKVNQYLNQTKIRKNHYENLKREFSKIDNSSLAGSNSSSIRHSQDITSPPVEKSKFAQNEKPKNKKRGKPVEAEKACNFCKQSSPSFVNDNDYDMHLWQDCPMLITCEQCTQVVEIADFTEHLLDECSNSQNFKECPKCRLAVDADGIEEHMRSNECVEVGEENVTCPLCLAVLDVDDDDFEKTWFEHLILQGCPKNTRALA
jgi:centrosomal protein CEP104